MQWERQEGRNTAFILADTFRYLEHCGPSSDDILGYRSDKYIDKWHSRDVIQKMEDYLNTYDENYNLEAAKIEIMERCNEMYNSSYERRSDGEEGKKMKSTDAIRLALHESMADKEKSVCMGLGINDPKKNL